MIMLLKNKIVNFFWENVPVQVKNVKHIYSHRETPPLWINDDFLYLHIPKSAGTSVAKALGRKETGHFTYDFLRAKYPKVENKDKYFVIMRNPIDRIGSTFKYVKGLHERYGSSILPEINRYENVNDFIMDGLVKSDIHNHYFLRPVSDFVLNIPKEKLYYVEFDNLNYNLKRFFNKELSQNIELPYENISPKIRNQTISSAASEVITSLYSDDYFIYSRLSGKGYIKNNVD
ncbi:hypothetical protein VCHA39O220_90043 [Vibrio chagasii]|nr:hypothetical protein VCHA39O220_90043 [Vibrio chagasii]CAH7484510.1 hypothetical protein VCHA39O224_80043 [Vibrio chagasii]